MNSITRMSRDEVHEYMDEHKIEVFLSYDEIYDKDGNLVDWVPLSEVQSHSDDDGDCQRRVAKEDDTVYEYWGFSGRTGFSTFDIHMNEDKAKYAAVVFMRLVTEYDMCFSDAETLASSYVTTYNVMEKPLTEEEQEEICQRAIAAIEAGNIIFLPDDDNDDVLTEIPVE